MPFICIVTRYKEFPCAFYMHSNKVHGNLHVPIIFIVTRYMEFPCAFYMHSNKVHGISLCLLYA